jgi:type III restriction enzyme
MLELCRFPAQRFQSDPERGFSIVLENDSAVLKWFKPGRGDFQFDYHQDESHEPDFVVETKRAKFICEPKASNEMTDRTVLDKAEAAAVWCEHATKHEHLYGGKPWSYLLIPHDAITETRTLQGLSAAYTSRAPTGVSAK